MKLWFFRTPCGRYGISQHKISRASMLLIDSGKMEGLFLGLGMSDYRVEPSVKPGDCITVELVPAGKKKKVRKG